MHNNRLKLYARRVKGNGDNEIVQSKRVDSKSKQALFVATDDAMTRLGRVMITQAGGR